jgi:hypothetical protein
MSETEGSGGIFQAMGESIGGFISGIPPAAGDFFAGVGQGAGIDGFVDWTLLLIGIALLLSVIRGLKRGKIVGPAVRGFIGVALMGLAVA